MAKGIILMTALVPTIGHQALIQFAINYLDVGGNDNTVNIILSSRDKEPIAGAIRKIAIYHQFRDYWAERFMVVHNHTDNDAPQNPEDSDTFWEYWKDTIEGFVGTVNPDDIVFASEPYGVKVAEILGCKYIPYDTGREIHHTKGTNVRKDLPWSFSEVMPEFQHNLRKTITIFGSESNGKTTMTRLMAEVMNGHSAPEWARTYLEAVGAELTPEKMATIHEGQRALQWSMKCLYNKPFIFQDTDLFSTVGYYQILGWDVSEKLIRDAKDNKSDLYLILQSNIPFEEDPLRYGGDVRQSNDQYWIDICEKFELNYNVVQASSIWQRQLECEDLIMDEFYPMPVQLFERE